MGILILIALIVILLLLFASSVLFSLIGWVLSLFGIGRSRGNYGAGSGTYNSSRQDGTGSSYRSGSSASATGWHYSPEAEYKRRKRKKIIDKDEGEYVDFEEIKK